MLKKKAGTTDTNTDAMIGTSLLHTPYPAEAYFCGIIKDHEMSCWTNLLTGFNPTHPVAGPGLVTLYYLQGLNNKPTVVKRANKSMSFFYLKYFSNFTDF